MWQQYRKTFVLSQAFIFIMCGMAHFVWNLPPVAVVGAFAVMQLASLTGAWAGARMLEKQKRREEKLPLER